MAYYYVIHNYRNKKRMFLDEFSHHEQIIILDWLQEKQALIVSDILK